MEKKPSLALIPSAYKAGKLYSVLPADGVGDFDFSRATTATRVNSEGLIETVGSNIPRLNYPMIDGVVSGCPSLLLEPARTNLIQYSEDFGNAYWTKSGASVVSGFVSPDGTANAFKLVEDSATSVHYMSATTLSLTAGGTYVYSFYVKPNGRTVIAHIDWSNATADVVIDIENETISGANTNIIAVNFTNVAGGFKRVEISYNLDVAQVQAKNRLYLYNGGITYTGDGTSGIYIWGAQLEAGSYPTSYIPTSGSVTTRNGETCNNAGDANTFNDSEGVLYIETSALSNDLSERRFGISDGTSSNVVRVGYTTVSNRIIAVIYNGTNQAVLTYTSSDITQNSKIAVKYKENDFALWVDGLERSTDISGSVFTANTLNSLDFNIGGGSAFYSKTKDVRIYNTALTDQELQQLTTL